MAGHSIFAELESERSMSRMALSEGVSRFQYMACVLGAAPDNADIVVIRSLLHAARIWGIIAIVNLVKMSILNTIGPNGIDRKYKEVVGLRLA